MKEEKEERGRERFKRQWKKRKSESNGLVQSHNIRREPSRFRPCARW